MKTKICNTCGTSQAVDQFYVKKDKKDGLQQKCKSCASEYAKQYYYAHRVTLTDRQKVYHNDNKLLISKKKKIYSQANKIAIAERMKIYYQANKVAIAEKQRVYHQANLEQRKAYNANHRSRRRNATGKHTAADIKELFVLQQGMCICCRASLKDGYHKDHNIPLEKGGSNDKYNLQLLCPPCNLSKGSKDPIKFMQSRGFLL